MVSSFLIKVAGVMLDNCVWKYHLNRARITLTLLMHWIGYSSFHLALNDFVLTFQVFFSYDTLSLSLSLIRSKFSPMLTNTCNLMHGFKLLFSNWTPNTCEEAYMSILSIRRHLTFLRLHTLCSKLLSCCCFYCHYDAYKSVSDRFPITPYVSFRWYIFFENINYRILYESTCFKLLRDF